MSSTYSIAIAGIKAGVAKEAAIKQLAELLKVFEEKVISMLNSHKFVVKSELILQHSAKYDAALQNAGGNIVVEPENPAEDLDFDITFPIKGQLPR